MTDVFDSARQHFVEGLASSQAGQFQAAETSFEASLALVPARPSTLTNLGAVRIRLEKFDLALVALTQACELDDTSAPAWGYRGQALLAQKNPAAALDCLLRAVALAPDQWLYWQLRSEAHFALDQSQQALQALDQVLALDPQHGLAWSNRGMLLRDLRRPQEAAISFQKAVALGNNPEINTFYLASLQGGAGEGAETAMAAAPALAPRQYVEQLFNDYADAFSSHLVKNLRYNGHELLVSWLRKPQNHPPPARFGRVLDAGCGTGLCGRLIRPVADYLEGVDLAESMVARARETGIYDALYHADATQHLQSTQQGFDVILAADVFNYVGDLAQIFAAAARALNPQGLLCFTVERAESVSGRAEMQLLPSLRYAHTETYVRRMASAHGLVVRDLFTAPIREDAGVPLQGLIVFLSKPVGAAPAA